MSDNKQSVLVQSEPVRFAEHKNNNGKSVLLIILIIMLGIIVCIETLIIFDVGNMRQKIGSMPYIGKIINRSDIDKQAELQRQQIELDNQKAELASREASITNKEAELQNREKSLNDRENELLKKENDLTTLETELNGKQMKLEDMVKLYESMDAQKAAAIFSKLDNNTLIIELLKNMKKDQAAAILSQLDPAKAAELSNDMQP